MEQGEGVLPYCGMLIQVKWELENAFAPMKVTDLSDVNGTESGEHICCTQVSMYALMCALLISYEGMTAVVSGQPTKAFGLMERSDLT